MTRLLVGVMVLFGVAYADPVTGAIEGRVSNGAPGVRVVASAGREVHTTYAAADGTFRFTALVPGDYFVEIDTDSERGIGLDVHVGLGVARIAFDLAKPGASHSPFDPASAAQRFEADRAYLDDVPATARTFDAVIGAAPGVAGDRYGVGFAGNTSADNRFILDGADTTSAARTTGTFLPSELVGSVTSTTGYGVEYGGSTGAQIAAVIPSGTNQLHGSVFGSLSPSFLAVGPAALGGAPQTIDVSSPSNSSSGFGFTVAGPVIRDRLWFFVGFAPQFGSADYTRTIERQTDCRIAQPDGSLSPCRPEYADGLVDLDPKTHFPLVDPVDSEVRTATAHSYPIVGKLALSLPASQASLSAIVVPGDRETPELIGEATTGSRVATLSSDVAAHWTSRLSDAVTIDGQLAWHRMTTNSGSLDPTLDTKPLAYLGTPTFGQLPESAKAKQACTGYSMIDDCPIDSYPTGGPGPLQHDLEDRESARVTVSDRIGSHEIKVGGELVAEATRTTHVYSGGEVDDTDSSGNLLTRQFYVNLESPSEHDPRFDYPCGTFTTRYNCQFIGGDVGAVGSSVLARSQSWAAFLGDTWRPRSDLTIEGGLRYESQHLLYPGDLAGQIDPITGDRVGNLALRFDNNIAPRFGVTFDPTNEGRAKVFAHWGRYFEQLPTTLTDASFSRLAYLTAISEPVGILAETVAPNGFAVDPNLEAGYSDELVVGGAFEPVAGLAVGATWRHQRLGRVVEDVAIADSQFSYELTNPGHGTTDHPIHDYDAIELTVSRRFLSKLMLEASYVYSRTTGNYTGTLDDDFSYSEATHHSTQFDSPDTIANSFGPLPQDRPHIVKLDGAYTISITPDSDLVVGARFRALSGTPEVATDGNSELLLPRGVLGRTDFVHTLDLHLAYRHRFEHAITGELYVDVLNVFNDQPASSVDNIYTPNSLVTVAPISGGTYSDLIWLRQTNGLASRSTTFGQTTSRYLPTFATLGGRVRF